MSRPSAPLLRSRDSATWNEPIESQPRDLTPFDPGLWAEKLGDLLGVDPSKFGGKPRNLSRSHARILGAIIASAPSGTATTCTIAQEELADIAGIIRGKPLSREHVNRELHRLKGQGWLDWKENRRRDLGHKQEGYRGWRSAPHTYCWTEATSKRVKVTLGTGEWEKITAGIADRVEPTCQPRLPFKKSH